MPAPLFQGGPGHFTHTGFYGYNHARRPRLEKAVVVYRAF